jgi:hypothetical protein
MAITFVPDPPAAQPCATDQNMSAQFNHTEKRVAPRARVLGRNNGVLTPFTPGDKHMTGYRKPSTYVETLRLARKHSPQAMMTLIRNLSHEDGRISTMSASLILERAWGRAREMKPEEQQQARIDLSALSGPELQLLLRLVQSGRLRSAPEQDEASVIEGKTSDD